MTPLEAARLANVSVSTLRKLAAAFESEGLAAVIADAREGPPSALDPYVAVIRAAFAAPCTSP